MLRRRLITAAAALAAVLFPAAAVATVVNGPDPRGGGERLAAAEVLERPAQRLRGAIVAEVRRMRAEERRRELARQRAAIAELGVSMATLEAVAACESGGDPTAVSSDGTYRGKYQFDYGTWASVGGSGDPAAAPEAEQDYRAALLYSRSGSSPWPVCGV
jgi:hypothetical protein